ncbi:MAG: FAD:protein FMN transferase [Spirochaetaceae bacterium]|nr:FAD:protein FMN transferase [Spirochaetaceae bacterium]
MAFSGCAEERRTEFALGTVCSVQLYDRGFPQVYNAVFSRVREIENLMSVTIPDSDIDRINRNAGGEPVQVHREVIAVLEKARYYAELSGGAFDPTIGPLARLWDIGSDHPRVPDPAEIQDALELVSWQDLLIDGTAQTVQLRRKGMSLDLGAIAKGYAADEAVKIIRQAGILRGIVDFGGNIACIGEKKDGAPWRIGVQNPAETRGAYIGILTVRNKSIVTSGVYERYAEIGGKRYHHILSASDGYPIENGLLSVTIIADSSVDADALSTAVFALGYEQGRALLETLGFAEGVFTLANQEIRFTKNAYPLFTPKN